MLEPPWCGIVVLITYRYLLLLFYGQARGPWRSHLGGKDGCWWHRVAVQYARARCGILAGEDGPYLYTR